MKKRIMDGSATASGALSSANATELSPTIEKNFLPNGLHLYRYRLSAFPPNIEDHNKLNYFLGALISKLMVMTRARMQPFICIDGRHVDDDFFSKLQQNGATWRPLLGFPLIPGIQPFRYLPIAYHIGSRDAWDEVAERFLGTGGTGIYLSPLSADDFLVRLTQLLFTRNSDGATELFSVFLPDAVIAYLEKATETTLERLLQCFQVFVGERSGIPAIDIVSAQDIDETVRSVAEAAALHGS
jgi:hypothetical protein